MLQGKKILFDGLARYLLYDSTEDGNIAAELSLGCNGRVGVLVQRLSPSHRAVLLALRERLEGGHDAQLLQCFASPRAEDLATLILLAERLQPLAESDRPAPPPSLAVTAALRCAVLEDSPRQWALTVQRAPVHLWIVGGGLDAEPVATLAASLGWRVTVADHRSAYARAARFPDAERIVRATSTDFQERLAADGVILMSHHLDVDAAWLARCSAGPAPHYIGLLGPADRREEVIARSGLDPDGALARSVHGPMGFDIGGDLPEAIALSVMAQCHRVLATRGRL